jgi:light-regulated signal transduction histidine kinase (bacteriophytochrome)
MYPHGALLVLDPDDALVAHTSGLLDSQPETLINQSAATVLSVAGVAPFGGTLEIESAPGRGKALCVHIPL